MELSNLVLRVLSILFHLKHVPDNIMNVSSLYQVACIYGPPAVTLPRFAKHVEKKMNPLNPFARPIHCSEARFHEKNGTANLLVE